MHLSLERVLIKPAKENLKKDLKMTQLINDLDSLRNGKISDLNIRGNNIKHARFNRFYLTTKKGMRIINEWDLILKLTNK